MEVVLVTGASGFIGSHLATYLKKRNFEVITLNRTPSNKKNNFHWNIDIGFIEKEAILKANYIIHLAGAGIADKRWTSSRKKELIESRTKSTSLLLNYVTKYNPNLKAFIAASGIGAYGAITSKTIFTEESNYGSDFIAHICKKWENSSFEFQNHNIRTAILRTGIVYSPNGGAFDKISKPIKLGIGAPIASGKQFMPWIHIDDLCAMYLYTLQNSTTKGIFNAVAPEHISNQEITQNLAKHFKKTLFLPAIPKFVFQFIFGELSCILTEGSRVSSEKIIKKGFCFKYSTFKSAFV